jgi:hypothetical protein
METATENAYYSILDTYTPLDIKDILTNGASRKAIHHKSKDDILEWYAEHNEGLHHTLLDSSPRCFTYYMTCMAAYNQSDKTHSDQYYFIRDIVWLFIDGVAKELGEQYELNTKTREEIQDEMLAIDLKHRQAQLHVIDGGKS